jgi:hypothetical protein
MISSMNVILESPKVKFTVLKNFHQCSYLTAFSLKYLSPKFKCYVKLRENKKYCLENLAKF